MLQLQRADAETLAADASPAAGATRQPGTAASSNGLTFLSPKPMSADHDQLTRIEAACAELAVARYPLLALAVVLINFRRVAQTVFCHRADRVEQCGCDWGHRCGSHHGQDRHRSVP